MIRWTSVRLVELSLLFPIFLVEVTSHTATPECACGRGGPCLRGISLLFDRSDPSIVANCPYYCNEMGSNFFYDDDCEEIRNICEFVTCQNGGTCVPTFGGFFCKCSDEHFGQYCSYNRSQYEDANDYPKNEIYVYTQLQTTKDGVKYPFYLIYDPGPQPGILQPVESGVKVIVEHTDGRQFFPIRSQHFKKRNLKAKCIKDSEENPNIYDIRVCDYLPNGAHWSYLFDQKYYGEPTDDMKIVKYRSPRRTTDELGYTVEVSIDLRLLSKNNSEVIIYKWKYWSFTYIAGRVQNSCVSLLHFDGCAERQKAKRYSRGKKIPISSYLFRDPASCKGTKLVSIRWFIQKDVGFEGQYDPVPVEYPDFENRRLVVFPPTFFNDGKQMIVVEVVIQGDPPHFGGMTFQRVFGRCWIEVELGRMNVGAIGGTAGTASCFHLLAIDFESLNPSMKISEMNFIISCDHPEDPECDEKDTEVPGIRKFNHPCNTVYKFNITVRHFISKPRYYNFGIKVSFQKRDPAIMIVCQYNCQPVDITKRVVVFGTTIPYIPGRMTWNVLIDEKPVPEHVIKPVEAFKPLTSSRCIWIDGMKFDTKKEVSVMTLTVNMGTQLSSTIQLETAVLKFIIDSYEYVSSSDGSGSFHYVLTKPYEVLHPPLIHVLAEVNPDIKESLVLSVFDTELTTAGYGLSSTSSWPAVVMCLSNAQDVQECGKINFVVPSSSHTELDSLFWFYSLGNTKDFLTDAVHWFYEGLVPYKSTQTNQSGRKKVVWRTSLKERSAVIAHMNQLQDLQLSNVHSILSTLTMAFFSAEGNAMEKLVNFHENYRGLEGMENWNVEVTEFVFHNWVDMQFDSMELLYRAAVFVHNLSRTEPSTLLPKFLPGDIFECMIKAWNLAHIQGTAIREMKKNLKWSLHRELMEAELDIKANKGSVLKLKVIHEIAKALPTWTILFYGIRVVGRSVSRMWSVRSTYQGISQALNRSNEGEHFSELANYIFGPRGHDGKGAKDEVDKWMNYLSLRLPSTNNVPSLEDKELVFVAFATRNRKADPEIGPLIYFRLINGNGTVYDRLPDGRKYRVTLPVMVDGEIANFSRIQTFNDTLLRPSDPDDRLKYYNVYKFTLPSRFDVWDLRIFTREQIPLKVVVSYETLPGIEDTDKQSEQVGKWDESLKHYELRIKVDTKEAKPGGVDSSGHQDTEHDYQKHKRNYSGPNAFDRPVYFYFGIVLTNETPANIPAEFHIKDNVDICEVQEPTFTRGRKRCTGIQEGEFKVIDCDCEEFGFIFARADYVSLTKILISPIEATFPVGPDISQTVIPVVLGLIIILLIAAFIVSDWLRRRHPALILIEDAYVKDSYPLIIGVYTGKNVAAGTMANVAIKVVGLSSSTRVHLLKSKKNKTFRAFNDDWFYIVTSEPLGRISSVIIWHDHSCLSEWYCDYILIFDVKQDQWYIANVEKWFRIDSDVESSRVKHIKTFRFTNLSVGLKAMPHKFRDAFLSETRNLHHFFSIFGLHVRSLQTYEQRYTIFVLKVLSMCITAWLLQEYDDEVHTLHEPDISVHVDEYIIMSIVLVAVTSYLITMPYYLLVRSTQMSGLVQKKTTHPVNLEVIKMEIKTTGPKEVKESVGSASVKKQPDTGIRTDSKGMKSVLFQIDSVDRTQSDQSWLATSKPPDEVITTATLKSKKHWSSTHYRIPTWRKILVLICGPCQYRCINVLYDMFEVKMRNRIIMARLGAAIVVTSAFIVIVVAERQTNLWRRTYLVLFVLAMALIVDILILNPLIIAVNILISHIILKTTGREITFWCDTIQLPSLEKLNFHDYVVSAIGKLRKPQLSVKIEALQAKKKKIQACKTCSLYAFVLLSILIITKLLMIRFDVGYVYSVRTIFATADVGPTYQVRPSYGIDEVITPYMVSKYIPSTFGDLRFLWPGGKHMSRDKGRWFLDFTSKPIGPINVVITFVSDKRKLNVAKVFRPFYDSAVGWLSESQVYTKDFTIADTYLQYEEVANYYVYGKTGDAYQLAGHTAHVPMTDWKTFYTTLGSLVEELLAQRNPSRQPRVMVLTYNLLNSFTNRVLTVDVIVEFLPAGISSVKMEVNSEKSKGTAFVQLILLRLTFVVLACVLAAINLIEISKIGIRSYLSEWHGILKLLMLVSVTTATLSTFLLFFPRYERFGRLFNYPSDIYLDLHSVISWEMVDSVILSLSLLVMCANIAVAIRDAAGIQLLSQASSASFRVTLAVLLSILIYSRAAGSSVGLYSQKRWFLWINVVLKTVFPIPVDELELTQLYLVFAIFILVVWSKVFTAMYIFQFEHHDAEYLNKNLVGDPNKQQAVSILKHRTVKKHSLEARHSHITESPKFLQRSSTLETTLAERKHSRISIRERLASTKSKDGQGLKVKS